ncbi:hypothetical protein GCM10010329_77880 [Streptomyces spiroverticillatus]|uniref:Uncharacterized protein n=1 Tax=Streptomyces finlayi TaxID=67296 RepID=A0A919CE41_9ACTN|nr:hypothetical protein [Streptomyces finlayi]GHA43437.1 hypothetical protein GCM10010329_77880 [Streptomyces spiroverticillatus]GHD13383.1 hypothetical protein GCM10010334_71470 [Streptomyces finlayi]
MIRTGCVLVWCHSRSRDGRPLDPVSRAALDRARAPFAEADLTPILDACADWAAHTHVLDDDALLPIWLMNLLVGLTSTLASRARPVPAPVGASLIDIAVQDPPHPADSTDTLCLLPPKDLGRRHFNPPHDWAALCADLGFAWRGENTPTCVYGWTGSWAMTYGPTDEESMAWYICGIDDHALVVRDGFASHDVHLPDATAGPGQQASLIEVVTGAMDIDLQEYVHSLHTPHRETGLTYDVHHELWWLTNGYNCAGPGYIRHGDAPFPDELTQMSLSIWAAGLYDIPYDCAYGNVLTHSRLLIGRLDELGLDREGAYHAVAGCLLRNVTDVLTGRDIASGAQGTLNWYIWALVIPRYSPGALLAGAALQVDRATVADLCETAPHGTHLTSRDAYHRAFDGKTELCTTCRPILLPAIFDLRTAASVPEALRARTVPADTSLLGTVDADDVDWNIVEDFDRWAERALDLARGANPATVPSLDHDGNEVLIRFMRLATTGDHQQVRTTVAVCALLSMARGRNISRLLGVLNVRSSTRPTTTPADGEVP